MNTNKIIRTIIYSLCLFLFFKLIFSINFTSRPIINLEFPNSESRLALNKNIKLSEASIIELETIPNISTTISKRILENKNSLINQAEDDYKKIQKIKGIGKVKGQTVLEYLDLE